MRTQIIPVIHYENDDQAMRNATRSFEAGCAGVFLIHMNGDNELLPPAARAIKERWSDKLIGINFLGMDPSLAVETNIANGLDMTWTDVQITHSTDENLHYVGSIARELKRAANHLVFVGVAFKHQPADPEPDLAARTACTFGFIPTTSGSATGVAAEVEKIRHLRAAIGDKAPLAIASGITPDNVDHFAPYLSHILAATGVSSSFYEFDIEKLRALRQAAT